MNDTLQMAADSLVKVSQQGNSLNWWMIIAIVELVIIVVLLLSKGKADERKRSIKRQVREEGDINFGNVIASSFGAKALYDELIRKCHPDRFFPDEEKVAIANDITERLGKYKNDLEKLNELKKEAIDNLGINL
jgi:hypothetical protein